MSQASVKKTMALSTSEASSLSIRLVDMASSSGIIFQPFSAGAKILVRRRISATRPIFTSSHWLRDSGDTAQEFGSDAGACNDA